MLNNKACWIFFTIIFLYAYLRSLLKLRPIPSAASSQLLRVNAHTAFSRYRLSMGTTGWSTRSWGIMKRMIILILRAKNFQNYSSWNSVHYSPKDMLDVFFFSPLIYYVPIFYFVDKEISILKFCSLQSQRHLGYDLVTSCNFIFGCLLYTLCYCVTFNV